MDANARMPGDAEAAGAIAGMADTYGQELPPIGSRVAFRLRCHDEAGWDAAKVVAHGEEDGHPTLVVELDDGAGLRVIDARLWPVGNRLDF